MTKFIKQCILFSFCCLCFLVYEHYEHYKYYKKIKWETLDSPRVKEKENLDVIVLGSSHANMGDFLSNYGFKIAFLNTNGGGINCQKLYLKSFFKKKNTTNMILYLIDPFILINKFDNLKPIPISDFDRVFLRFSISDFSLKEIIDFGKKYKEYFKIYEERREEGVNSPNNLILTEQLTSIDTSKIAQRIDELYQAYVDIEKEKEKLIKTIDFLRTENQLHKLIFCIPPTLLGEKEPYQKELIEFLENLKSINNIPYYDYSKVYYNPSKIEYFYDYDHLNRDGQIAFSENYLLPILNRLVTL